jgi:hypothetical protein
MREGDFYYNSRWERTKSWLIVIAAAAWLAILAGSIYGNLGSDASPYSDMDQPVYRGR